MFETRDIIISTASTTVSTQQVSSVPTAMRVQVTNATMPSPQQAVTKASKLPGNTNGSGEMSAGASPRPNSRPGHNFQAKFCGLLDSAATELPKSDESPIPEPPKSAGPQIGVQQSPLHELSTHASPLSVPPLNVTKGQGERAKYKSPNFLSGSVEFSINQSSENTSSTVTVIDGQTSKNIIKAPIVNLPLASQNQPTSSTSVTNTKSVVANNNTTSNSYTEDKSLKMDISTSDQVDDIFGDTALSGIDAESDLFMKTKDLANLPADDIFEILENGNTNDISRNAMNNDNEFFSSNSTSTNKKFDTEIDSMFGNVMPDIGNQPPFSSNAQPTNNINKMQPPQVCYHFVFVG